MITDPVTCNNSADTARHSGTSALIGFALLNGRRGARSNTLRQAVIIPVIGLKIGVCARQKSSKSEKIRA